MNFKKVLSIVLVVSLVFSFTNIIAKEETHDNQLPSGNQETIIAIDDSINSEEPPIESNNEPLTDSQISFNEYMSTERFYEDKGQIDDGFGIICENNQIVKQEGEFGAEKEIVKTITPPHSISVNNLSHNDTMIYVVIDNNKVVRYDRNLENYQEVFSTDKVIERLFACDNDVLYLMLDTGYYLYHLNSQTLFLMYENERAWGYMPLSNKKLYADIYNENGWLEVNGLKEPNDDGISPLHDRYIYNCETSELTKYEPDYLAASDPSIFKGPPAKLRSSLDSNVAINAVSLPLIEYPVNTYFNNVSIKNENGEIIPTACNHSVYGVAHCKTYADGMQCKGFANYVYDRLYGTGATNSATVVTAPQILNTFGKAKNFIDNIPVGSHIRIENNIHSVILLGKNNNGIYVYHANVPGGTCRVATSYYTYEQFCALFTSKGVTSYKVGGGCNHSKDQFAEDGVNCTICYCKLSSTSKPHSQTTSHNNGKHIVSCSTCTKLLSEIAYQPYYEHTNTNHTVKCNITGCGHSTTQAPHTFTYIPSGTNHQKSCGVCGYVVAQPHTGEVWQLTTLSALPKMCLWV